VLAPTANKEAKMRLHFLPIFIAFVFAAATAAATAQAQAICPIIAKYFVDAPSGFISERGEPEEEGSWKSNQSFPNSDCGIEERKANGRHTVRCIINSGSDFDTIVSYGKRVERDIASCLRQIPNGSDYIKEVENTSEGGRTDTITSWTNEASEATYKISISATRTARGRLYNTLVVSWTPSRRRR
jgi:hypothetical protein